MKERLLRASFTEGASLSDRDVLIEIAADVGLDPETQDGPGCDDDGCQV